MARLLDTDPDYNFSWRLIPFNGHTENEFEWNLKVDSNYLELGVKGYTEAELDRLNNYFSSSEYKFTTKEYTLPTAEKDYEEFAKEADRIAKLIIKEAL